MLTGVVEVGLFCHMTKAAYFGNQVWSNVLLLILTFYLLFRVVCRTAALQSSGTTERSNISHLIRSLASDYYLGYFYHHVRNRNKINVVILRIIS
jgi:hypothetical protein